MRLPGSRCPLTEVGFNLIRGCYGDQAHEQVSLVGVAGGSDCLVTVDQGKQVFRLELKILAEINGFHQVIFKDFLTAPFGDNNAVINDKGPGTYIQRFPDIMIRN